MKNRLSFFIFFIYLSSSFVFADKIASLPGLDATLNFDQYSDYITIGNNRDRHLHYWFVESQNDPNKDPLVLWLNGGPGCSSLLGLMTEHGPFRFSKDGNSLELNPYSWNKVANVIYLEAPAGVGYSYSDSQTYVSNDQQNAIDNYNFILGWFKQFPQFIDNEFILAGESYAGHYIPQLAQIIMDRNADGHFYVNLQGVMTGNPSTSWNFDANSHLPFLAQHALAGYSDFINTNTTCNGVFWPNPDPQCKAAITNIYNRMSTRINPYNIYEDCVGEGPSSPGYCFTQTILLKGVPTGQTYVPCMNMTNPMTYFNRPDVRQALFANNASGYWEVCSTRLSYSSNVSDMVPTYNELVKHYPVMIYSGDVDTCVNYLGTQQAAMTIETTGAKQDWTAWFVEDQVAGYKLILGDNLTFVTVKGAGHMVPQYRPKQALAMFTRFIKRQPL